jgi:hypothetical protein
MNRYVSSLHGGRHTNEDTVAATLGSGTDLECPNFPVLAKSSQSALDKHQINISDIDTAISRKFVHFIALGELEGPETIPYQTLGPEHVDTTAHRELSLAVAEQAMTLLKNEPPTAAGEVGVGGAVGAPGAAGAAAVLPLSKSAKIALIGPQANITLAMLSDYAGHNKLVLNHSVYMAARAAGLAVVYTPGHDLDISSGNKRLIPAAAAAAKAADVAVVVLGLCADNCVGRGRTEDEGVDRVVTTLPGAQQPLLEAIVAAQPKTVLVLINGGMLSIGWAKDHVPAILEAYYPGQLGGDAIVNTLLGLNNPGGKTPTTWYDDSFAKSRPMDAMNLDTGDGLTHMYYTKTPLWPFGWGLSYTSFSYSCHTTLSSGVSTAGGGAGVTADGTGVAMTTQELSRGGVAAVVASCTVKNTGALYAGEAVVLGLLNSSEPQFPRQRLFDFARTALLAPGVSQVVTLRASAEDLSVVDEEGRRWLRPSSFRLRLGDVVSPATVALRLTGVELLLEDSVAGAFNAAGGTAPASAVLKADDTVAARRRLTLGDDHPGGGGDVSNCSAVQHGVCLHNAYPIIKSFGSASQPVSVAQCCANCTAEPKCISWNINTGMKSCFLRGSYKTNPGAQCISGCVRGTCHPPPPPPPPPAPPLPSANCNATTRLLQGLLDAAAERGGGWARVPCGFHATLALRLPSGVKLGAAGCVGAETTEEGNTSSLLRLGVCDSEMQDHLVAIMPGTGQLISGVIFDHANFTKPSQAVTSSVPGNMDNITEEFSAGSFGFVLEHCQFLNIATTDRCPPPKCQHTNGMQGYSAIGLSGCVGCVIRGNHVPHSGGDALNFNSGEYIVTENLVENTGDGCIAMNNNAFGTVSNNILRRCNLGIGAGPSGGCNMPCPPNFPLPNCGCGNPRGTGGDTNSTPFIVSGNTIEDCDYGMLLGWFGYKGRLGPMNTVISSNVIRRSRQAAIQYRGDGVDGAVIISGNQIVHSGYPNLVPPGPESRRPIDPSKPGYGRGIFAWSLQDVQVRAMRAQSGRPLSVCLINVCGADHRQLGLSRPWSGHQFRGRDARYHFRQPALGRRGGRQRHGWHRGGGLDGCDGPGQQRERVRQGGH